MNTGAAAAAARGRIYLSPPHMGRAERALLLDAFDGNWIAPTGPHLDAFEHAAARALGAADAVALSSGTAALHLALHLLGVAPGDTVVMPTFTFVATANAARYCGATPVFVDRGHDDWHMCPDLLEEALTTAAARGRLPRAVITVDTYGDCADYGRIVPLCARFGVPIVEDAAAALGARCGGAAAGTLGTIGIISLNGNKIVTTGGGGLLTAQDPALVARARHLAGQARLPVPHFEHHELGFNYRMGNLAAALGRGQLARLAARVRARRARDARYRAALGGLAGVAFMPCRRRADWNGWLSCCLIAGDDPRGWVAPRGRRRPEAAAAAVRAALAAADIEARPLYKPLHLQPAFTGAPAFGGERAAALFERGLALPTGSSLSAADQGAVIATFAAALGRREAA